MAGRLGGWGLRASSDKAPPQKKSLVRAWVGGLSHSSSEVLGTNDGAPKCQLWPPWLFFSEGHCKDISHVSFNVHFLTLLLPNSAPGSMANKQETVNSKSLMPLG